MSESQAEVRTEIDGAIGWLIFDHQARRNAMTLQMWRSVPELCADLGDNEQVRVVILRGAGEVAFVAGADISQFTENRKGSQAKAYDEAVEEAQSAIEAVPKPTLAMIHGFCIGGGLGLAIAADIRYAADDARFGLPPARLGIGYAPKGVAKLVDLVGPSVTKEIIYTGETVDAPTALGWGLVNHVTPKSELEAMVRTRAEIMAARAPLSQLAAKVAVADHLLDPADRQPDMVARAVARCFDSADYAEGVAAFMERRAPVFKGR